MDQVGIHENMHGHRCCAWVVTNKEFLDKFGKHAPRPNAEKKIQPEAAEYCEHIGVLVMQLHCCSRHAINAFGVIESCGEHQCPTSRAQEEGMEEFDKTW